MKTRYFLGLAFATIKVNGKEIEALIDTGFNGSLMLPLDEVQKSNLKRVGKAQYTMADGTVSESLIFMAEIEWFNGRKKVPVISSASEFPLIGMELLFYTKLTIHPSKDVLVIEDGS
ncbi:MAG: aspartyl protease family protein [Nanoarchaeota archaeon]